MAEDIGLDNLPDPRWPWWFSDHFYFSPPSEAYERDRWRTAVLQHAIVQDVVMLIRARSGRGLLLAAFQERLDDQDRWFPLKPTIAALDIDAPRETLWPLPQPRDIGSEQPNTWLLGLDLEASDEWAWSRVFIPLGLVVSRLTPLSPRPLIRVFVIWLAYCVLPVCARHGGPANWAALDRMLNPVPQS